MKFIVIKREHRFSERLHYNLGYDFDTPVSESSEIKDDGEILEEIKGSMFMLIKDCVKKLAEGKTVYVRRIPSDEKTSPYIVVDVVIAPVPEYPDDYGYEGSL